MWSYLACFRNRPQMKHPAARRVTSVLSFLLHTRTHLPNKRPTSLKAKKKGGISPYTQMTTSNLRLAGLYHNSIAGIPKTKEVNLTYSVAKKNKATLT